VAADHKPGPSFRRIARLLRARDGFTMVELLAALFILAVGVMATITTFDVSRRLVTQSERKESATHRGEQELERIVADSYAYAGLTATPQSSSDPNHPGFYVNTGPPATYQTNTTPPKTEPLVIDSVAGKVPPTKTWSDGRLSGSIYNYVTWVDDPCCTGTQDYKRVTVAVTLDGEGGPKKPILLSSVVRDPGVSAP
jgi:prepilin-type N-terminal cleavage/methylation domain-containing protein